MSKRPYFWNTQCHPNIISWGGIRQTPLLLAHITREIYNAIS